MRAITTPLPSRSLLARLTAAALLALVAGLICGSAVLADPPAVTDTFGRLDSTDLGATEDSAHYPWVKAADLTASITGGRLLMREETATGKGAAIGGGFSPADIDLSVTVYDRTDGFLSGLSYRSPVAGLPSDAGYTVVWVINPAYGKWIVLMHGGIVVKQYDFATPVDFSVPHTVRVLAVGPTHQVWFDGLRVLDYYNTDNTSGGYVNLLTWLETRFDDLTVQPISPGAVADTFSRTDNLDLGTTEDAGHYAWVKDAGVISSVTGQQLYLRDNTVTGKGAAIGGGFAPANFDLTTTAYDRTDGFLSGISYRSAQPGLVSSDGYCVTWIMNPAWGKWITLMRGSVSLQQHDFPAPVDFSVPHTVRIKADGPVHQVWFDGQQVINYTDNANLAGGYINLMSWLETRFDGIVVRPTTIQNPGSIGGTIRDAATGNAIQDAVVKAGGALTANSNSQGQYSIPGLAAGQYTLTVLHDGHYISKRTVTVAANATTTADFGLVAIPAPSQTITDTFSRANNTNLGTTEDSGHYPWMAGDIEYFASISNQSLLLDSDWEDSGVGIGTLQCADIDLSVDLSLIAPQSTDPNWAGIGYRCSELGNYTEGLQEGYVVKVSPTSQVSLCYGSVIRSAGIVPALDWSQPHILRVQAVGIHHQVWVDGTKLIDEIDDRKTDKGFVNLIRNISGARYDNLTVADVDPLPSTITGVVSKEGAPLVHVADAFVDITDNGQTQTVRTDGNGSYTATVVTASPEVDIRFEAQGYEPVTSTVSPVPGGTATKNAAMTSIAGPNVIDRFTRDNGADLGATEDPAAHPWVKGAGTNATINGRQLLLKGTTAGNYAGIDGYTTADFDLTVDGSEPGAGFLSGLTYRSPQPGVADANTYQVIWKSNSEWIILFKNGRVLQYYYPGTTIDYSKPHRLRVRAVGAQHQVWFDGVKILDVLNNDNVGAGYINLATWNVYGTQFDNLTISAAAPQAAASIAALKTLEDDSLVRLSGVVVTGRFTGCVYVEDKDRAAGIKVVTAAQPAPGSEVTLVGTLGTSGGERVLNVFWADVQITGVDPVAPLGMNSHSFIPQSGLSNNALLTRVWGNVTSVGSDGTFFYLTDGSTEVKVLLPAGVSAPSINATVACTGVARIVSGTPVLQMRADTDLTLF